MSKELVGKNGCIVGSERYIETLHKEHPIGIWMQNKSASDYRRGLGTLNDNIGKVIDKVYQDLRKVGSAMSYFPNDQRI